jgi:hypothetical protein
MNSADELLPQPQHSQQKPSSSFKSLIWKIIFIPLLIINLGLGCGVLLGSDFGQNLNAGSLVLIPFFGVLAFIDLIAVLSYVVTQHPQNVARNISYAVLVPIVLVLMYVLYFLFDAWWRHFIQ